MWKETNWKEPLPLFPHGQPLRGIPNTRMSFIYCMWKEFFVLFRFYDFRLSMTVYVYRNAIHTCQLNETVDGIMIECDTSLNHLVENKKQRVTWTIITRTIYLKNKKGLFTHTIQLTLKLCAIRKSIDGEYCTPLVVIAVCFF